MGETEVRDAETRGHGDAEMGRNRDAGTRRMGETGFERTRLKDREEGA
jgi:hypothetical protein